MLKIYNLFEEPKIYKDLNIRKEIFSSFCLVFEGVLDFNSFVLKISELFSSKPKIIEISNDIAFVFNISIQDFDQFMLNQIKILHYDIFSIFLKRSHLKNIINNKLTSLNSDLFYIYFEENYQFYFPNNSSTHKIQDIKITASNPKKHFYGFLNFTDLLTFYTDIIQSTKNWPIFAISPFEYQNNDQLNFDQSNFISHKSYPQFIPLKSLFYISFIQKVPPLPQRKFNVDEIYGIKRISDVQISHSDKFTIRTFLGFENKFRCIYIFDYLNGHLSKSSSNIIDIRLNIDNADDVCIHSNYFYLELFNFYDSSIEFSMNHINVFNFENCDKLTTFYCFDDEKDFTHAKSLLKKSISNNFTIKNIKLIEKEDLQILFPQKSDTNEFYHLIFRVKNNQKKREIENLLQGFKCMINDDVICSLDSNKYTVVGFHDNNERKKAFISLINSQYSVFLKSYYPQNYVKPSFVNKELKEPQFKPKKGMFYFYFEEYEKSKTNFSSNYLRPIFGIKTLSDLQRNYYLPNSNTQFTFIGFNNENEMNQILRESYSYQNVLITNAKNGQIYKYKNELNEQTTSVSNNYNEIQLDTSQTNSISKNETSSFLSPQFIPKKGMFYLYFQEHEGGKPRYPSDNVSPLFGIKSLTDLQRNYYLPNSKIEYTFVGFPSKEIMEQVYHESFARKNKLITNTKDGKIFKYLDINNAKSDINNTTLSKQIELNSNQLFKPKSGLFYFYFEENDGSKPRFPSNYVTPLFGIKNMSDLQRSYCLPDSPTLFTFIGFSKKEEMENICSESYPGRKVLLSNVKNFKIYKYNNNQEIKPISVTKPDSLTKINISKSNENQSKIRNNNQNNSEIHQNSNNNPIHINSINDNQNNIEIQSNSNSDTNNSNNNSNDTQKTIIKDTEKFNQDKSNPFDFNLNIDKEINSKMNVKSSKIGKVKVNFYQSFYGDESLISLCINNSLPDSIKKSINIVCHRIGCIKLKQNIVSHSVPNSLCMYYIFPNLFIYLQFKQIISTIVMKHNFQIISPETDYLLFDEKLIPRQELTAFIQFLERGNNQIKEIKRNVFDGYQISTCLSILVSNQPQLIERIKTYLLEKDLIFNTKLYSLENTIIIKEKLIFNNNVDFDIIIDAIESIKPNIIINIFRNKLYLYNNHPSNHLFQICSFICFKNKIDKMIALNRINTILYKGNKNILIYKYNLNYASIDYSIYPKHIRDLIPKFFGELKGMLDFQDNVLSIESPVERSYIGFDTMNHLKKGYAKFNHRLSIVLNHPDYKLFNRIDNLLYLVIVLLNNFKGDFRNVINRIYHLTADIQMDCSEVINDKCIDACFLGFISFDELDRAKSILESDPIFRDSLFIKYYSEGKTFLTQKYDSEEAFLYYNSF